LYPNKKPLPFDWPGQTGARRRETGRVDIPGSGPCSSAPDGGMQLANNILQAVAYYPAGDSSKTKSRENLLHYTVWSNGQ